MSVCSLVAEWMAPYPCPAHAHPVGWTMQHPEQRFALTKKEMRVLAKRHVEAPSAALMTTSTSGREHRPLSSKAAPGDDPPRTQLQHVIMLKSPLLSHRPRICFARRLFFYNPAQTGHVASPLPYTESYYQVILRYQSRIHGMIPFSLLRTSLLFDFR